MAIVVLILELLSSYQHNYFNMESSHDDSFDWLYACISRLPEAISNCGNNNKLKNADLRQNVSKIFEHNQQTKWILVIQRHDRNKIMQINDITNIILTHIMMEMQLNKVPKWSTFKSDVGNHIHIPNKHHFRMWSRKNMSNDTNCNDCNQLYHDSIKDDEQRLL